MNENILLPAVTAGGQIMPDSELDKLSVLALAHVGDGVYELLVRTMLCGHGIGKVSDLHRKTVTYVCAPAQAKAIKKIMPMLTEKETQMYKRGRNSKMHAAPQKATVGEYHAATGLETLFGYLYLKGQYDRIGQLFRAIMEE
jgi:ribonuclease-3 family protein